MSAPEIKLPLSEQRDEAVTLLKRLRREQKISELNYTMSVQAVHEAFKVTSKEFFVELFEAAHKACREKLKERLRKSINVDEKARLNLQLSRLDAGETLSAVFVKDTSWKI